MIQRTTTETPETVHVVRRVYGLAPRHERAFRLAIVGLCVDFHMPSCALGRVFEVSVFVLPAEADSFATQLDDIAAGLGARSFVR